MTDTRFVPRHAFFVRGKGLHGQKLVSFKMALRHATRA